MGEERLTAIRRGLAAWNDGEFEWLTEDVHPDVEVHGRLARLRGRPYRGHVGIREWYQDARQSFDYFQVGIGELREVGDQVVGRGRAAWCGKGGGPEEEEELGWVWTFRGERIIRMEIFDTPAEAMRAVGPAEGAADAPP